MPTIEDLEAAGRAAHEAWRVRSDLLAELMTLGAQRINAQIHGHHASAIALTARYDRCEAAYEDAILADRAAFAEFLAISDAISAKNFPWRRP